MKARGEAPAEAEAGSAAEKAESDAKVVAQTETPVKAEAAAPDPWEGVNPALKAMLEGISTKVGEVDKLGQRFKSFEGRLGHVQNAIAAANAAAKVGGAGAPTQAQVKEAMQSTAKWDALMADMGPDWKEAFEEKLAAQAAVLSKNAPAVDAGKIKKELEEGFTRSVHEISEASTQKARQLTQLDIKYPTWEQDIKQPEFKPWLDAQAPEMQALMGSDSATDALKVLDAYAEHRKAAEKQEKNKARLAAAVTPRQATSGGPSVLPDEAGLEVGYKRAKRLT